MKPDRVSRTLILDRKIDEALHRVSCELSIKHKKKITRSQVVEKALIKFGVKPCSKE